MGFIDMFSSTTSVHRSYPGAAMELTPPTTPERRIAQTVARHRPRTSSRPIYHASNVNPTIPNQFSTGGCTLAGEGAQASGPEQPLDLVHHEPDRSIIDLSERSGPLSTQTFLRAPLTLSAHPAVGSRAASQLVPSRIGRRLSAFHRLFRFNPVTENDDADSPNPALNLSRAVLNSVHGSSPADSPVPSRSRRSQPCARLSIILTPPLQPSGSHDVVSPPPTAILAVLEEGHNRIVRTAMKQDALVRSFALSGLA